MPCVQLQRPDLPDLDVVLVERVPAYAFDASPNAPRGGDPVRYVVHIRNSGSQPTGPFSFTWTLDGHTVGAGRSDELVAPGAQMTLGYSMPFEMGPHTLRFGLLPSTAEISNRNDMLGIRTDALSLGYWVEESAYRYFNDNQWLFCQSLTCAGSNSLEDWLQRTVRAWNDMLASARSNMAPDGVADRVRVGAVTVVPDGSLPLHGPVASNDPDLNNHSVDLQWGLPFRGIRGPYPLRKDTGFNIDWSLIHELGHARYLTDVYRFDYPLQTQNALDVRGVDGRPVANPQSPFDPTATLPAFVGESAFPFLYANAVGDIMSCECAHFYDQYDAVALNRIRGQRARCGNANPPCNIGEWITDIPPLIRFVVREANGKRIPSTARVRLFADTGTTYTEHRFDMTHVTDLPVQQGTVQLPDDPFRWGTSSWLPARNLLLVEVASSHEDHFCFLDPTRLNLAYWSGYRDIAHPAQFSMSVDAEPNNGCSLHAPPVIVNAPFSTSPYTSRVVLAASAHSTAHGSRTVHVHLLDDGGNIGMRNRALDILDSRGTLVGTLVTDRSGVGSTQIPPPGPFISIVDRTDSDLMLTPGGHSQIAVPQP